MEQKTSSLPLVFTVISGVALLGLTLFTVISIYRHRLPRCLRLVLAAVCMVGTTGLSAFMLCHYGLFTRTLTLALGDQLLLAPHTDADLDSRLFQLFCHSLRVSSDKPGLTVWTAAVSPNRVTDRLYTLLLPVSAISSLLLLHICRHPLCVFLYEVNHMALKRAIPVYVKKL